MEWLLSVKYYCRTTGKEIEYSKILDSLQAYEEVSIWMRYKPSPAYPDGIRANEIKLTPVLS